MRRNWNGETVLMERNNATVDNLTVFFMDFLPAARQVSASLTLTLGGTLCGQCLSAFVILFAGDNVSLGLLR